MKFGWVVGIVEGEGYIGNTRPGCPVVRVATTDKDVAYRLLEWTNLGNVRLRNQPTSTGKQVWIWDITRRDDTAKFLDEILPYLSERRSATASQAIMDWRDRGLTKGQQTHCKRGHSYSSYISVDGRRRCKKCIDLRSGIYQSGGLAEDL